MRTRNSIPTCFYLVPAYRELSNDARSLLLYLNTNTYTNLLGCYYLPLNIIEEELQWEYVKVVKSLDELIGQLLIAYDAKQEWVWVKDYLIWNPIYNESLAQGLAKCFWQIPPTVNFFKALVNDLLRYHSQLTPNFIHQLNAIKGRRIKTPEHARVQTLKLLKKAYACVVAMH